jgi:hypothetical protein
MSHYKIPIHIRAHSSALHVTSDNLIKVAVHLPFHLTSSACLCKRLLAHGWHLSFHKTPQVYWQPRIPLRSCGPWPSDSTQCLSGENDKTRIHMLDLVLVCPGEVLNHAYIQIILQSWQNYFVLWPFETFPMPLGLQVLGVNEGRPNLCASCVSWVKALLNGARRHRIGDNTCRIKGQSTSRELAMGQNMSKPWCTLK